MEAEQDKQKKIPVKYKNLAKKECANRIGQKCLGTEEICRLEKNEPCKYFTEAVLPLLSSKYTK